MARNVDQAPAWSWVTLLVWTLTFGCVAVIGGIALLFVLMASSLDPLQILNAGAEPWVDVVEWSTAFLIEIIAAAIGLRLWHAARLRPLALMIVAAQIVSAVWACLFLRADYF